LLVVARLEPLYLHRSKPLVPAKTYFHLWTLVAHVIGCGQKAYLEAFGDPASITKHLPALTNQTGLYPQAVFRFEQMTFEAQKLRLLEAYTYPHDAEAKRALDAKLLDETLATATPFERAVFRVAKAVSGFFHALPDVRASFKGSRFDRGYPERYPIFDELDSGEVVARAETQSSEVRPLGVKTDDAA
jgi:hypothetical protein